ncbi:unnamed protein product, partial [Iphiclides podalirius]
MYRTRYLVSGSPHCYLETTKKAWAGPLSALASLPMKQAAYLDTCLQREGAAASDNGPSAVGGRVRFPLAGAVGAY